MLGQCAGIRSNKRQEDVQREEEYTIWEKRHRGLCNMSEYWVGHPTKRTVTETKEIVDYELEPEAIKVGAKWPIFSKAFSSIEAPRPSDVLKSLAASKSCIVLFIR